MHHRGCIHEIKHWHVTFKCSWGHASSPKLKFSSVRKGSCRFLMPSFLMSLLLGPHTQSGSYHPGNVMGNKNLPLIARFMGPTWGPSGADRTQVGPMLAIWTLLSGTISCNGQPLRVISIITLHVSWDCVFIMGSLVTQPVVYSDP